ncbi:putative enzyme [Clostridium neonatale]|uniref:Enzyme n=1 Tax=Clostridium neonatale TaxID=137838 RepID=A0AA86JWJ1_9CLOT|nr:putative enzyme [Clostridium neonatale]
MNKVLLDSLIKKEDYLILDSDKFQVVFTNAEKNRSFNRATEEGKKYLNSLSGEFNLEKVVYIKQIHSDKILEYTGKDINDMEGDAVITNIKKIAVGIFTADCVPVILVDEVRKVVAAIHSGWRGTFESITFKTIEKMKNEFKCNEKILKPILDLILENVAMKFLKNLKINL